MIYYLYMYQYLHGGDHGRGWQKADIYLDHGENGFMDPCVDPGEQAQSFSFWLGEDGDIFQD